MEKKFYEAIETHRKLLDRFSSECLDTVTAAAGRISGAIRQGGCIYICGNGGSAADAQHIAGELVGRFARQRRAFPAVALTTDTSVITAVANDYSFADIFSRQVEALVRQGDVLWAFSTSGSSQNILAAAELARGKKAFVLAFTGRKDTALERICDLCLAIDAPNAAAAQQIHQIAYHIICDLVEEALCL